MSVTNNAIMFLTRRQAITEVVGGPAATQNTATRLSNTISRTTRSAATGSFILPSILSGEASQPMMLVNDTAVAVNVYPSIGEKINGAANAALSIAAGATGMLFPVLNSPQNYPSTLDWRGQVFT